MNKDINLLEALIQDINEIAVGTDPIVGKPQRTIWHTEKLTTYPDHIDTIKKRLSDAFDGNEVFHRKLGNAPGGKVHLEFYMKAGETKPTPAAEAVKTATEKRARFIAGLGVSPEQLKQISTKVQDKTNFTAIGIGADANPFTFQQVREIKNTADKRNAKGSPTVPLQRAVQSRRRQSIPYLVHLHDLLLPNKGEEANATAFHAVRDRLIQQVGRASNVIAGAKALKKPKTFIDPEGKLDPTVSDPMKAEREAQDTGASTKTRFASLLKDIGADLDSTFERQQQAQSATGTGRTYARMSFEDRVARAKENKLAQATGTALGHQEAIAAGVAGVTRVQTYDDKVNKTVTNTLAAEEGKTIAQKLTTDQRLHRARVRTSELAVLRQEREQAKAAKEAVKTTTTELSPELAAALEKHRDARKT